MRKSSFFVVLVAIFSLSLIPSSLAQIPPTPDQPDELNLHAGWNMIASPVTESFGVENLRTAGCNVLASSNGYVAWSLNNPPEGTVSWENAPTFPSGKGVYVRLGGTCKVSYSGTPFTHASTTLGYGNHPTTGSPIGSNIIAGDGRSLRTISGDCNFAEFTSPAIAGAKIVHWNGSGWDKVSMSDVLERGKSYWVKVGRSCTIGTPAEPSKEYKLSLSSEGVSVEAGMSTKVAVNVNALVSSPKEASLGCEVGGKVDWIQPGQTGISCTISTATCKGSCTYELLLETPRYAPADAYPVGVTVYKKPDHDRALRDEDLLAEPLVFTLTVTQPKVTAATTLYTISTPKDDAIFRQTFTPPIKVQSVCWDFEPSLRYRGDETVQGVVVKGSDGKEYLYNKPGMGDVSVKEAGTDIKGCLEENWFSYYRQWESNKLVLDNAAAVGVAISRGNFQFDNVTLNITQLPPA